MQLGAAVVQIPVHQFLAGAAEGHGGEEVVARVLAAEVVVGRVIQIGLTSGHRVEHLEGAHEGAGRVLLDGDVFRHRVDRVGEILRGVVKHGKALGHRGDQTQGALALGISRGGQRGGRGRGAAKCGILQK